MTDMPTLKRSVHARLLLAARRGVGVRLSHEDVQQLCADDAVRQRALKDLGEWSEDD